MNASGETYTEGNLYDAREEYRDAENALIVVRVFAYGFITLMSLICVANVFNTTTTNVLLRRRDFAMLRSAGMTRGGLNRMICYECLLYGTRACSSACRCRLRWPSDVSLRLFHRRVVLPAGLDGCAHCVGHGVPRCVSLNDVCHAQDQARQSRRCPEERNDLTASRSCHCEGTRSDPAAGILQTEYPKDLLCAGKGGPFVRF